LSDIGGVSAADASNDATALAIALGWLGDKEWQIHLK
jgi:hypothetical protein